VQRQQRSSKQAMLANQLQLIDEEAKSLLDRQKE